MNMVYSVVSGINHFQERAHELAGPNFLDPGNMQEPQYITNNIDKIFRSMIVGSLYGIVGAIYLGGFEILRLIVYAIVNIFHPLTIPIVSIATTVFLFSSAFIAIGLVTGFIYGSVCYFLDDEEVPSISHSSTLDHRSSNSYHAY